MFRLVLGAACHTRWAAFCRRQSRRNHQDITWSGTSSIRATNSPPTFTVLLPKGRCLGKLQLCRVNFMRCTQNHGPAGSTPSRSPLGDREPAVPPSPIEGAHRGPVQPPCTPADAFPLGHLHWSEIAAAALYDAMAASIGPLQKSCPANHPLLRHRVLGRGMYPRSRAVFDVVRRSTSYASPSAERRRAAGRPRRMSRLAVILRHSTTGVLPQKDLFLVNL